MLPENVYHSYLGEYFLGQTDIISFGGGYNAWGALVNLATSNVNMFLNAYTITNFSNVPLTGEGWLSIILPRIRTTSPYFAAGNQTIIPVPMPKVEIQNASFVPGYPSGGTYTFVRRVEPSETLTKHDFQGMYIIPPGSSFSLFFYHREISRYMRESLLAGGKKKHDETKEKYVQNIFRKIKFAIENSAKISRCFNFCNTILL